MIEMLEVLQSAIILGLIYSVVIFGVFLTSRIIKFDDLSVEGSFGCGGAIAAQLLLSGYNLALIFPIVVIVGSLIGVITGLIHTKLKINNLISGIVVATAVFSVNLKIAGANISLMHIPTIFSYSSNLLPEEFVALLVPSLFSFGFFYLFKWFLNTEVGFMLKAVGDNSQVLISLGKSVDFYKILGLAIANASTATAGALFVQYTGFFSVMGSVGILVVALAGLILSEVITDSFSLALIVGAIFYQIIIATTFEFQVDPAWNKFISSALIILFILLKKNISHYKGVK